MLEYQRYLIVPTRRWFAAGPSWHIHDAESGTLIGLIEESIGWLSRIIRYTLSRRIARSRYDVRELLDESLLFSIVKPSGLFARRYDVVDSQDDFVGSIGKRQTWDVRDRHGTTIARTAGSIAQGTYEIITAEGKFTLAEVKRNGRGPFTIDLADDFDESPFAKMLILGIVFLIELSSPTRKR